MTSATRAPPPPPCQDKGWWRRRRPAVGNRPDADHAGHARIEQLMSTHNLSNRLGGVSLNMSKLCGSSLSTPYSLQP